ncbi:ABC transporter substrate-binding protein [Kribbella sp. NBC_01245]|uniref:ABC transporter substrate-binding protein n=1 Tax=Kribbella sp. NBC_01245 TaxID=2903578 RepID=UPI002E286A1C|nr:ABC transporter substrate-binding protein [Kribbella sp. NBC_01245]
MRRRIAFLLTAVCALALTGCGGGGDDNAGGPAKVTLTLNWVPYGEHAPFYYGVDKGYFKDEGIELTINPGNGSGNTVKAVAQGQTDFGWADAASVAHGVGNGMPIKSLGVYLQKGPSSLEFFSTQNIKTPADLKGKKIAGTAGDALWSTFPAWLKANGLAESDVQLVNVDAAGKIAALIEGKVDVIMGFFHDQAPTIEAKSGKKVDVLVWADTGLNLLGTGLVVNEKTLKDDPALAEKFVRATQKSWADAAKDPAAAVQAMAGKAEQAPAAEVMQKQLEKAIPLLQLDTAGGPGVNTDKQWTDTIDVLKTYADLKNPAEPAKYWDGKYAKATG